MSGEFGGGLVAGGTPTRKLDHIQGALDQWMGGVENAFDDVQFVHNALPSLDATSIDTSVEFLGRKFDYPLMLTAMTGGHPDVGWINRLVGHLGAEFNIPVGVGSQRAALEDPSLVPTFSAVRELNENGFVVANIGIYQLARAPEPPDLLRRCVEMIRADALAIHLNSIQEAIQPEGDRDRVDALDAIRTAVRESPVPVIVKEVGCGISGPAAKNIAGTGAAAVDIAGSGGTDFCAIEAIRTGVPSSGGLSQVRTAWGALSGWGIPTPVAVRWASADSGVPVVGSGGLRSGVDLARALALGATIGGACGVLLPTIFPKGRAVMHGVDEDRAFERARDFLRLFLHQLETLMVNQDCATVSGLKEVPLVVTGTTRDWFSDLGLGRLKNLREKPK
ncbi:MAG: type 2 isopentenyl-diphosphate Delta-isomerase [Promethearchaeota archaeon]